MDIKLYIPTTDFNTWIKGSAILIVLLGLLIEFFHYFCGNLSFNAIKFLALEAFALSSNLVQLQVGKITQGSVASAFRQFLYTVVSRKVQQKCKIVRDNVVVTMGNDGQRLFNWNFRHFIMTEGNITYTCIYAFPSSNSVNLNQETPNYYYP